MAARRNHATQETIPGTDKDKDKALDKQIATVAELTDQWKALRVEMDAERAKLMDMMKAKGLSEYHATDLAPPRTAKIVEAVEKVTITKDKNADDPDAAPAGVTVE